MATDTGYNVNTQYTNKTYKVSFEAGQLDPHYPLFAEIRCHDGLLPDGSYPAGARPFHLVCTAHTSTSIDQEGQAVQACRAASWRHG